MPVWAWIVLIGSLGLLVVSVLAIVPATHRLRSHKPLHGDPHDIAAPVPLQTMSSLPVQTTALPNRELSGDGPAGTTRQASAAGVYSWRRSVPQAAT